MSVGPKLRLDWRLPRSVIVRDNGSGMPLPCKYLPQSRNLPTRQPFNPGNRPARALPAYLPCFAHV